MSNYKKVMIVGWAIIGSFFLGFFGFLFAYNGDLYIIDDADPFEKNSALGYNILHAAFDAVGQFFFNRDKGGYLNWAIAISQFTAPLSMVGGVMVLIAYFQNMIDLVRSRICRLCGGEVIAIYGDGEERKEIIRSQKATKRRQVLVYPEEEIFKPATHHILFFRDDRHSLQFFEDNREFFHSNEKKKVYMVFSQTDPFLFTKEQSEQTLSNVYFVNVNEMIAKDFWREHDLLKYKRDKKLEVNIAIVGFSDLARTLLHYGVILNCYETNQKIHYYVWGDTSLQQKALTNLDEKISDAEMDDRIIYQTEDLTSAVDQLGDMDRIILTEECCAEYVQTIIRKYPETDIFFVDPEGSSLDQLRGSHVKSYASRRSYDVGRILREAEHAAGKQLNARYAVVYEKYYRNEEDSHVGGFDDAWKEKKWQELTPFLKESNDVAAEYHVIRERILYNKQQDEMIKKNNGGIDTENNIAEIINREDWVRELCILEHNRWCRFHFMNGWEYASKESLNGERKDEERRLHSDLVKFDELRDSDEKNEQHAEEKGLSYEQTKDLESVAALLTDTSLRGEQVVLPDRVRQALILQMALARYQKSAERFWSIHEKQIIPEGEKHGRIKITGFDIAGIAFVHTFREKVEEGMTLEFDCQGDPELLKIAGDTTKLSEANMVLCMDGCDGEKNRVKTETTLWNRFYLQEKVNPKTGEIEIEKNDKLTDCTQ